MSRIEEESFNGWVSPWDQYIQRDVAAEAGRNPWSWASLPGLQGRRLSTRFSIGDHWEEFSLHDCRDTSMAARARAWLTSERRPEPRKP